MMMLRILCQIMIMMTIMFNIRMTIDRTVENPMSYNDDDDNHVQEGVGQMLMMR
jgi:hypothetical protein